MEDHQGRHNDRRDSSPAPILQEPNAGGRNAAGNGQDRKANDRGDPACKVHNRKWNIWRQGDMPGLDEPANEHGRQPSNPRENRASDQQPSQNVDVHAHVAFRLLINQGRC